MATEPKTGCNCQVDPGRVVFACSGAADVGEIAERAARELHREGAARMSCAAAIGAGIEDVVRMARDARLRLVIDGCDKRCVSECMERAGIQDYLRLDLTEMGMEKGKSPLRYGSVIEVVAQARRMLRESDAVSK